VFENQFARGKKKGGVQNWGPHFAPLVLQRLEKNKTRQKHRIFPSWQVFALFAGPPYKQACSNSKSRHITARRLTFPSFPHNFTANSSPLYCIYTRTAGSDLRLIKKNCDLQRSRCHGNPRYKQSDTFLYQLAHDTLHPNFSIISILHICVSPSLFITSHSLFPPHALSPVHCCQ